MNNKSITVIGGDSRQLYAAEFLLNSGFKVNIYACEHGKMPTAATESQSLKDAFAAEYILFPLPTSKNNKTINTPLSSKIIMLRDITEATLENNVIFLGMGHPSFVKQLEAKAKNVCDYFRIENLTYKNALLTAEGLLNIVLDKLPVTVFGLKIAITGYGRIAYFISDMLKKLGADVTIYARNNVQLTKAELKGLKTSQIMNLSSEANKYDCIINTIPAQIIDNKTISSTSKECILIEAASAPYGIDQEACEEYDRNLVRAFSLPGKTAPKSAGYIIGEVINNTIKEMS